MDCSWVEQHLKEQPTWILVLFTIGLFNILKLSILLLSWTYINFLRLPKNLRRYGSWAVITGSTDGIGRAFALELAGKGLNVLLVGRNPDKLREVSAAVQAKHGNVQVETVVLDFSGDLTDGISRLKGAVEQLDVGVLVNSAGVLHRRPRFFHEVEEEIWCNMINVNLVGLTLAIHAVLPGMLRRKRGAIVNIGSASAHVIPSFPLYSIYASTKKYVNQLSKCLHVEYRNRGIDVQCQVPLFIATKMTNMRSSIFVPSAEEFARTAVTCVGYEAQCIPNWTHSLQWFVVSLVPNTILDAVCLKWVVRGRGSRRAKQS